MHVDVHLKLTQYCESTILRYDHIADQLSFNKTLKNEKKKKRVRCHNRKFFSHLMSSSYKPALAPPILGISFPVSVYISHTLFNMNHISALDGGGKTLF